MDIENRAKMTDPEYIFFVRTVKWGAAVIAFAIALSVFVWWVINYRTEVFGLDLKIFDGGSFSRSVNFIYSSQGETGKALSVRIDRAVCSGDTVSVTVSGKNLTDEAIEITPSTFALSSFNAKASETRYHYYPDLSDSVLVGAGHEYAIRLDFTLTDAETRLDNGYIYSLTAFRGYENGYGDTIEIIIDEYSRE